MSNSPDFDYQFHQFIARRNILRNNFLTPSVVNIFDINNETNEDRYNNDDYFDEKKSEQEDSDTETEHELIQSATLINNDDSGSEFDSEYSENYDSDDLDLDSKQDTEIIWGGDLREDSDDTHQDVEFIIKDVGYEKNSDNSAENTYKDELDIIKKSLAETNRERESLADKCQGLQTQLLILHQKLEQANLDKKQACAFRDEMVEERDEMMEEKEMLIEELDDLKKERDSNSRLLEQEIQKREVVQQQFEDADENCRINHSFLIKEKMEKKAYLEKLHDMMSESENWETLYTQLEQDSDSEIKQLESNYEKLQQESNNKIESLQLEIENLKLIHKKELDSSREGYDMKIQDLLSAQNENNHKNDIVKRELRESSRDSKREAENYRLEKDSLERLVKKQTNEIKGFRDQLFIARLRIDQAQKTHIGEMSVFKKKHEVLYKPLKILLFVVCLQVILGIFTLTSGLNIYLASIHQITSVLLVFSALNLYYFRVK